MLTIELPKLHDKQKEVMDHPARFKVLACGRRWGKSRLAALTTLMKAVQGGVAWWVAPSFPVASIGWRMIKSLARPIPNKEVREKDLRIKIGNGSLQVKSADNTDSLRGEGLDFMVMDEAAFAREEAWVEALRPALADKKGSAMFCSTPYGANWFYNIFNLGNDEAITDWQSWKLPTYTNPFIEQSEIDAAKETMPEAKFRQEFLAEFMLGGNGVFRNYSECVKGKFEDPAPNGEYIMTVDLAKTVDFTVILVFCKHRRHLVHIERFQQVDWAVQQRKIHEIAMRYNYPFILMDSSGVGDPIVEQLQRTNLTVQGIKITRHNKRVMIEALIVALEKTHITFPAHPLIQHELDIYQATDSGIGVTFSAPKGQHDDIVMAMAFAANYFRYGQVRVVPL